MPGGSSAQGKRSSSIIVHTMHSHGEGLNCRRLPGGWGCVRCVVVCVVQGSGEGSDAYGGARARGSKLVQGLVWIQETTSAPTPAPVRTARTTWDPANFFFSGFVDA